MRALTVVLSLLLVAGCGQANAGTPVPEEKGMPADFAGTVEYRNGTVAPPYHYEWRLTFDESSAVLEWRPGYEDTTAPWRESVDITADQRERLHGRLGDLGVFGMAEPEDDGTVGGPTGSVTVTADGRTDDPVALGQDEDGADLLEDVAAAVAELFPARVWDGLAARQEAWGEARIK